MSEHDEIPRIGRREPVKQADLPEWNRHKLCGWCGESFYREDGDRWVQFCSVKCARSAKAANTP
jgi:hypothetical protein